MVARTVTVKIDAAGRIVVPQDVRVALGIDTPGTIELDVGADGAVVRPRRPATAVEEEDGLLVVSVGRPVTNDETLAAISRDRDARS